MGTDKIGGIIMEVVQRPPDYDPEKGVGTNDFLPDFRSPG